MQCHDVKSGCTRNSICRRCKLKGINYSRNKQTHSHLWISSLCCEDAKFWAGFGSIRVSLLGCWCWAGPPNFVGVNFRFRFCSTAAASVPLFGRRIFSEGLEEGGGTIFTCISYCIIRRETMLTMIFYNKMSNLALFFELTAQLKLLQF